MTNTTTKAQLQGPIRVNAREVTIPLFRVGAPRPDREVLRVLLGR